MTDTITTNVGPVLRQLADLFDERHQAREACHAARLGLERIEDSMAAKLRDVLAAEPGLLHALQQPLDGTTWKTRVLTASDPKPAPEPVTPTVPQPPPAVPGGSDGAEQSSIGARGFIEIGVAPQPEDAEEDAGDVVEHPMRPGDAARGTILPLAAYARARGTTKPYLEALIRAGKISNLALVDGGARVRVRVADEEAAEGLDPAQSAFCRACRDALGMARMPLPEEEKPAHSLSVERAVDILRADEFAVIAPDANDPRWLIGTIRLSERDMLAMAQRIADRKKRVAA